MSDIGWVVGHSYIVYAPLVCGATTVFREGSIDFPHTGIALRGHREVRRDGRLHRADGVCGC